MFSKENILKLNVFVLFMAAIMDLIRGIMHTYGVKYAAVNLAGIEPIPDSLVLMGSFGISNFLTAFIYFLVIWKARELAPYVLIFIPISYVIGALGFTQFQNVPLEAEFLGQYLMKPYLIICAITALTYFLPFRSGQLKSS
ncbi:hypothetical protein [Poritiphilus flavus]|uniref:Uncharacterized protein n=1 Tax=Poritiphilus flavus TaxID=2697053 RepID=A0A6L9EFH3_9FLAO|nr:hypothetical protein [Poritiphilus flavus]NAS13039.1 hypothetical protein [Poritiphilus flavus]